MSRYSMIRRSVIRRGLGRRVPSRGFTLIELMIAMLLGLIVIAGVVSVFLAGQRSYRTNEALGDVQDGSRIAFELMAVDIRQAGLTGCGNERIANILKNGPTNGGTDWWANLGNAVHGYSSGDPALAGLTTGVQVTGTDSLQLMGAADTGLSVSITPSPTAGNFKISEPTTTVGQGDVIVVCDPDHALVVQVSNYNDSNITLVHNTGSTVSPGNCSDGLGYPAVCTPTGNPYTYGANSQIFKLTAVDWYIGTNPAGSSSLYRMTVDTSGAAAAFPAQEMVRGVTGMTIRYHQALQTGFLAASAVTDWSAVDAVQVALSVQSAFQNAGTDAKPLTRNFTATTTVRNRVN